MPYLPTIAFAQESAGANSPVHVPYHEDIYVIKTPTAPTTLNTRSRTLLTSQVNMTLPTGKHGRILGGYFPDEYGVIGGTSHTHALPTVAVGGPTLIAPYVMKSSVGSNQTPTADTEMCTVAILDSPMIIGTTSGW